VEVTSRSGDTSLLVLVKPAWAPSHFKFLLGNSQQPKLHGTEPTTASYPAKGRQWQSMEQVVPLEIPTIQSCSCSTSASLAACGRERGQQGDGMRSCEVCILYGAWCVETLFWSSLFSVARFLITALIWQEACARQDFSEGTMSCSGGKQNRLHY
jgi:hypothetical protein